MILKLLNKHTNGVGQESGEESIDESATRRRVLRSSWAVSASILGVSGGSMSALAADETTDKLSKPELHEAVDEALKSSDVRKIRKEVDVIASVIRGRASGKEVKTDESTHRIVRIPVTLEGVPSTRGIGDAENYILWSNSEHIRTMASYVQRQKDDSLTTVNIVITEDGVETHEKGIHEVKGRPHDGGPSISTPIISPGGPCGWAQRPNWSCIEDTVQENEEVSRSCSTCAAALATGANPATVVACGWCTWDLLQNGISGAGCSLCE